MTPTPLTRWLTPADVPAVRRLSRRAFPGGAAWSCRALRAFLRHGLNNGLVVEADGRVVGCLLYGIDLPHAALCVLHLVVAPRWRRRGLGTRLLGDLAAYVRAVPLARVQAVVHERNLPAQLFLRGAGFRARLILRGRFGEDDGYVFEAIG